MIDVTQGNNVRSAVASKIFLYQLAQVITLMLFTYHYYHGVALFLVDEDMEEGEQLAEEEEEEEVGLQLVPAACPSARARTPPVADWLE